MENTMLVDDVLAALLGEESASEVIELDVDDARMPVAKSSVAWTVTAHC
jgi:hypothetical protein